MFPDGWQPNPNQGGGGGRLQPLEPHQPSSTCGGQHCRDIILVDKDPKYSLHHATAAHEKATKTDGGGGEVAASIPSYEILPTSSESESEEGNNNNSAFDHVCELVERDQPQLALRGLLPVHVAAFCGNLKGLQELYDKAGAEAFRKPTVLTSRGVVEFAARGNEIEVLEWLLEKNVFGANSSKYFDHANEKGATPLVIAAQEGNFEVVKFLLDEANVSVHTETKKKRNVLSYAAGSACDLEMVKYLVEKHGAKIGSDSDKLCFAVIEEMKEKPSNGFAIFKFLVDVCGLKVNPDFPKAFGIDNNNADENNNNNNNNSDMLEPTSAAAAGGGDGGEKEKEQQEKEQQKKKKKKEDKFPSSELQEHDFIPPLVHVALCPDLKIAVSATKFIIFTCLEDKQKLTRSEIWEKYVKRTSFAEVGVLHAAASQNNVELLKFYLEDFCEPDEKKNLSIKIGMTKIGSPLHHACLGAHADAVDYLVQQYAKQQQKKNSTSSSSSSSLLASDLVNGPVPRSEIIPLHIALQCAASYNLEEHHPILLSHQRNNNDSSPQVRLLRIVSTFYANGLKPRTYKIKNPNFDNKKNNNNNNNEKEAIDYTEPIALQPFPLPVLLLVADMGENLHGTFLPSLSLWNSLSSSNNVITMRYARDQFQAHIPRTSSVNSDESSVKSFVIDPFYGSIANDIDTTHVKAGSAEDPTSIALLKFMYSSGTFFFGDAFSPSSSSASSFGLGSSRGFVNFLEHKVADSILYFLQSSTTWLRNPKRFFPSSSSSSLDFGKLDRIASQQNKKFPSSPWAGLN